MTAFKVKNGLIVGNSTEVSSILDEDNMASDSASALSTQQSIKAYVDAETANIASDTLTFTNKTFDANGTGNSISNIDFADFTSGVVLDEDNMASDSATNLATQQSIKAYVDTQISAISSTAISEGNSSATIADSGSGTLTVNMDGTNVAVFNSSNLTMTGSILPSADTTYDLGSSSFQWQNIYTGDLHLNNEQRHSGNSVDGTRGNWTVQEGAEDLYIINNNSGKKYKFSLVEMGE